MRSQKKRMAIYKRIRHREKNEYIEDDHIKTIKASSLYGLNKKHTLVNICSITTHNKIFPPSAA